jgi:hypothetical protein
VQCVSWDFEAAGKKKTLANTLNLTQEHDYDASSPTHEFILLSLHMIIL